MLVPSVKSLVLLLVLYIGVSQARMLHKYSQQGDQHGNQHGNQQGGSSDGTPDGSSDIDFLASGCFRHCEK